MEKKWWHQAVVYQIYPRSFMDSNHDGIGDLQGIISKLDYLQTLGVDVIWLSPVFKSPMDDNGYDISDYHEIAPEFGTMADMESLISEAKSRGISIIMDLVVNHTSDEHPWFQAAKSSLNNPYRAYYIWRKPLPDGSLPSDLTSMFGGSAWELDESTGEYYFHLFSKRQPDLNWENPKVQTAIHDMMNWWLAKGIGGFRMDVIDLIGKEIDKEVFSNGPRLHDLLQEMNAATFGGHDVLTVGETWSATPEIAKLYADPKRKELSMIFQFEHVTLTWDSVHGKWKPVPLDFIKLKQTFAKWQTAFSGDGWNSLFWNNHDLPRAVSKYGESSKYRIESAKMLAIALHLMKGTPYIYQGEELGMTNVAFEKIDDYRDIETLNFYTEKTKAGFTPDEMMSAIYENSRDNARTPMQWSTALHAGFTDGLPWIQVNPNYQDINANLAQADSHSIFYTYQQLIALRKSHDLIIYGDFNLILEDDRHVFGYTRCYDNKTLLVLCNFTDQFVEVTLPNELKGSLGICLISNYKNRERLEATVHLQPYEAFALLLN